MDREEMAADIMAAHIMAAHIMATSPTKLLLFHSIRLCFIKNANNLA